MTCLVLIITSMIVVLAADDAVTLENRIYDGIEKIHCLSDNPPLGIMIYGNSDFGEIPLENIIAEYTKNTNFKKINTVVKVKNDFLNYVNTNLKFENIDEYLNNELERFKTEIEDDLSAAAIEYLTHEKEKIRKPKEFEKFKLNFEDIVPENLTEKEMIILKNNLEYTFFENISEKNCGIVIAGIDRKTMQGSYCQFEMIMNTENEVLIDEIDEEIDIAGSKIKIFAQDEVIKGFLNGIDEELQEELSENIHMYINDALNHFLDNVKKKKILNPKDIKKIENEIINIKDISLAKYDFKNNMENMKIDNINKVSEELEGMSKEELVKMSKTLIDITRLNQIIHCERETVGNNVSIFVLSLKNGIENYC